MKISHIKKSAIYLIMKIVSGIVFGIGVAIGIYGVYSFQTSSVSPTSTGTGTADNKNTSTTFPMMTRTSTGAYDRNTMSMEAVSKMLQSMGAFVDDPFPGSMVAMSTIVKTNIVRHAASGTKVWNRCFRASTDGDNFSILRSKCSGKGPLLFLSLAYNWNVLEGYLNTSLPASNPSATIGTSPGTYIAYSSTNGGNMYYVPNSGYSFWDSNYKCFGYQSTTYAWCISIAESGTVKSQYIYSSLSYVTPTTFPTDIGWSSGWYMNVSEVEVWY